jgi:L-ascorbate metabolism protein UlaG (beta-lactamase superfamily)
MRMTWYGHSAFRLDFQGKALLIDPFFTGNPGFGGDEEAAIKGISHVLLTHGHADHTGDVVNIARKTGAKVVTNFDLCQWLGTKGVEKCDPMNTGGTTDQGGFTVTMVRADHSSAQFENGVSQALGNPCGIIVKAPGEPTVYHLGDTDIFSDMALISEIHEPQVAMVPIGDRFTMGPKTAALAVKRFLNVKTVIPCHYGSFVPYVEASADSFVAEMKGHATKVIVPQKGEAFDV